MNALLLNHLTGGSQSVSHLYFTSSLSSHSPNSYKEKVEQQQQQCGGEYLNFSDDFQIRNRFCQGALLTLVLWVFKLPPVVVVLGTGGGE